MKKSYSTKMDRFIHNSGLNVISYNIDPLLNSTNKNIYACLVKKKDFNSNFSLRTPRIGISHKEEICYLAKQMFGDFNKGFLQFIRNLEIYTGIKFFSIYKAKYRYLQLFNKGIVNIVFLRVISLTLGKSQKENEDIFNSLIVDKGNVKVEGINLRIDCFSKTISYLAGVIVGDGHLSKREGELVIVDGQSNKKKLLKSEKYLRFISNLFRREFDAKGIVTQESKTWLEYHLNNKYLCRFFNYYLEIPFGKKSSIVKFPTSLIGENERYFWRGVMDTDGYARENRKQVSLKSNSRLLINQLKNFCEKHSVPVSVKTEGKTSSLRILTKGLLNYSRVIGFSHPRKKAILIGHLKDGPKFVVFKRTLKSLSGFSNLFNILRPYKTVTYIKLDEHNQKAKKIEIRNVLSEIRSKFRVNITRVKRNRYNYQFVICSKKFAHFVKQNAVYELPWQPLNNLEVKQLMEGWKL